MKNLAIILSLMILFAGCGQKQKDDGIPKNVKEKFSADYPNVTDAEWETEGEYFEAEAMVDGKMTSIIYDAEGNVIETEVEIAIEDLPEAAMTYLQHNFPGTKIMELEKGNHFEKGDFYEVEILQGNMELEIYFDKDGNFIETIKEEPEEGEEMEEEEGLNIVIEPITESEEETPVLIEDLPEAISNYISENYPGQSISEAVIEKMDDMEVYEVEVTSPAGDEVELIFDMEGNFIKVEEDMEEADLDDQTEMEEE
jgi:uncharacterized membrane protein YkoI